MNIPYNSARCPSPYIAIIISDETNTRQASRFARIDTGADRTIIPNNLVDELDLTVETGERVLGVHGPAKILPLCTVNIQIHDNLYDNLCVFVAEKNNICLLGMDIINLWYMKLNGPQKTGYYC